MTPDGAVATADATVVVLPAADGELGVLAGHAPLVTLLGAGVLMFEDAAGKQSKFWAAGGFAHVRENAVSILPEECFTLDKLDVAAATQELDRAQSMPQDNYEATARRAAALNAAGKKLHLAQELKKGK